MFSKNMIKDLLFMVDNSDYNSENGAFSFEAFLGFLMGFILVGHINVFYGAVCAWGTI